MSSQCELLNFIIFLRKYMQSLEINYSQNYIERSMPQLLSCALYSLGTLFSLKVIKIVHRIYPYLTSHSPYYKSLSKQIKQNSQKYILVTGASDGIGKQFCRYCIQNDYNVILCSKNLKKINTVIQQLQSQVPDKNHVRMKAMEIDFANFTYKSFMQTLQQLSIPHNSIAGVINSCGMASLNPLEQHPISQENGNKLIPTAQKIRNVNILPLEMFLTFGSAQPLKVKTESNQFHEYLSAHKQNLPFLIHISSLTAKYPLQWCAHYSATKSYTSTLIKSYLKQTTYPHPFQVLLVQPWYIRTKMIGNKASYDSIETTQIVENVMKILGKRQSCTGSIKHQIVDEIYGTYFIGEHIRNWAVHKRQQNNYERVKKMIALKSRKNPKQK